MKLRPTSDSNSMSIATDEAGLDDFPAGFCGETGLTGLGSAVLKALTGLLGPEMARQMLI
jgi:hypothetical protein